MGSLKNRSERVDGKAHRAQEPQRTAVRENSEHGATRPSARALGFSNCPVASLREIRAQLTLVLLGAAAAAAYAVYLSLSAAVAPSEPLGLRVTGGWHSVYQRVMSTGDLVPMGRAKIERILAILPEAATPISVTLLRAARVQVGSLDGDLALEVMNPAAMRLLPLQSGEVGRQDCALSARWLARSGLPALPASLRIDGAAVAIVAVVPASFTSLSSLDPVDLWCPWDAAVDLGAPNTVPGSSLSRHELAQVAPTHRLLVRFSEAFSAADWATRTAHLTLPRFGGVEEPAELKHVQGWTLNLKRRAQGVLNLEIFKLTVLAALAFALLVVATQRLITAAEKASERSLQRVLGAQAWDLARPMLKIAAIAGVAAVLCGGAVAWFALRALRADPTLENLLALPLALRSDALGAGAVLALLLVVLVIFMELALIFRQFALKRLVLSARAVSARMRLSALAIAALACFSMLATWIALSQISALNMPLLQAFGLKPDSVFVQLEQDFRRGFSTPDALQAATIAQAIGLRFDRQIAFVDVAPGSKAAFVGEDAETAHPGCLSRSALLGASAQFLQLSGSHIAAGRAPTDVAEVTISAASALRCFGGTRQALGQRLRFTDLLDEQYAIVGIHQDLDFSLGSGAELGAAIGEYGLNIGSLALYSGRQNRDLDAALERALREILPALTALKSRPLQDRVVELNRLRVYVSRGILLISLGLLIASSLSLMVLMRWCLTHSARAIAIHRALGARHQDILKLLALPVLGGLSLAAGLSWIIGRWFAHAQPVSASLLNPSLNLTSCLIVVLLTLSVIAVQLMQLQHRSGLQRALMNDA